VSEKTRFLKMLSFFWAVLAVPIILFMAGVITLTVAWGNYGVRGGWGFTDVLVMICGVIYPVLAIVAYRKVRNQADSRVVLAWSFVPVPVLLILMVLLVRFSGILR